MVSAGRFRGGKFQRNTTATRRLANAEREGTPTLDPFRQFERQQWAQNQADALEESLQQEQITPYWLEPVGGTGIYVSPAEPVDPMDCDRYPGSPWCGGSGVDPIDLATFSPVGGGVTFTANSDGTEYCVQIDMTLFAVNLAPIHYCYRTPDARPFDPRPPEDPGIPGGASPQFQTPPQWTGLTPFPGTGSSCVHMAVFRYWHKMGGEPELVPSVNNSYTYGDYIAGQTLGYWTWIGDSISGVSDIYGDSWYLLLVSSHNGQLTYYEFDFPHYTTEYDKAPSVIDIYPVQFFGQPACIPDPPNYLPPPPPSPSSPPDMACCPETNELLRLIARRLGTSSYPVSVPKSLVDDSNATEKQESLTELLFWTIKQMDALAGQFPIEIEIKDADPSQQGDQARKVKVPNIAEGIAELMGLGIKTSVNSDIHTSFLMRLAAEIIATKNATLVAQDYAKANASYLGYKGNTVKRRVDYAFNVTKLENLEKILEGSQKNIMGWQDEDKNTVQAYLEKLMFAAGIIKQAFFRPNSEENRLLEQVSNLLGVNEQENESQENGWREFLKAINDSNGGFNRNSPTTPKVIDPTVNFDNVGGGLTGNNDQVSGGS